MQTTRPNFNKQNQFNCTAPFDRHIRAPSTSSSVVELHPSFASEPPCCLKFALVRTCMAPCIPKMGRPCVSSTLPCMPCFLSTKDRVWSEAVYALLSLLCLLVCRVCLAFSLQKTVCGVRRCMPCFLSTSEAVYALLSLYKRPCVERGGVCLAFSLGARRCMPCFLSTKDRVWSEAVYALLPVSSSLPCMPCFLSTSVERGGVCLAFSLGARRCMPCFLSLGARRCMPCFLSTKGRVWSEAVYALLSL
ncbi:unnamed protein product [Ectocarpus sp. 12 AP-2014]